MNSMERVIASLEGNEIDRRAVSLTLSLYGARLTNCPLTEYFTNPESYARGQAAIRATFPTDILLGPFALPLLGKSFGSKVRFYENQPPNLSQPAIDSVADIDKLVPPDIENQPELLYFRRAIQKMSADCNGEMPIAAVALDPVTLPAMIMGLDEWLLTFLFDEDGMKRMLDITVPYCVNLINALLADGAACVILPSIFINPKIVTRELALKKTIPVLKNAFSQVKGPLVIHSTGANFGSFVDIFSDLPNVGAIVLNRGDRLEDARRKIGPDLPLIGNLDGATLDKKTPAHIFSRCMEILNDRKDDTRFILGTAAADIPYDTPPENIHAIGRAVAEFYGKN